MYDGSDEDFWADSESSDFDSGNSSDEELQDGVRMHIQSVCYSTCSLLADPPQGSNVIMYLKNNRFKSYRVIQRVSPNVYSFSS